MNLEAQLSINDMIGRNMADMLKTASAERVDLFVHHGPFDKDSDAACRYLLAVALHGVTAAEFVTLTGVSEEVAAKLLEWLENNRVTFGVECPR